MKHILGGIVAVVALAAAGPVAASTSWSFTTATTADTVCTAGICTSSAAVGSGFGANTTTTLTGAGYSNTNNNGLGMAVGDSANAYLLETAYSTTVFNTQSGSGGLGIYNKDGCALLGSGSNCDGSEEASPEHSTDNNGRYDMILLTFSQQVSLRQVTIGWFQTDSDITVLAFNAVGNPGNGTVSNDGSLLSKTWGTMPSWTAIGSYANLAENSASDINPNKFYSSQWLIGAYNPVANPGGGANLDGGNDYVQLKTFTGCVYGDSTSTGCTTPVPEPGSLALLGLAMAGMVALRRRKKS